MRWLYTTTHKDIGLFNVMRCGPASARISLCVPSGSHNVKPMTYLGWGKFRMVAQWLYWSFLADVLLLTWLGGNEITPITSVVTQLCIGYLFLYLLVFQSLVCYRQTQYSRSAVPRYLLTSRKWGQKSFGFSTLTPRNNASWFSNLLSGLLKQYVSWLKLLFKLAYYLIASEVLTQVALVANIAGYLLHNALLVFGSIAFLIFLLSVNLTLLMIVAILDKVAPDFTKDAVGVTPYVWVANQKAVTAGLYKAAALVTVAVIAYNAGCVYYASMVATSAMEQAAATIPDTEPFKFDKLLELYKDTFATTLDRFDLSPKNVLKTWYDGFSK